MNSVVLIGRLVRDPELRFVPGSGTAVAKMTLAIDKGLSREKKQEFESQGKPTADFIRVIVWGKQAENCSQYLAKGKMTAVQGSIQSGSYETDKGEKRFTTEVLASRIEFLEWGEKREKKDDEDYSFEDFRQLPNDDDVPF